MYGKKVLTRPSWCTKPYKSCMHTSNRALDPTPCSAAQSNVAADEYFRLSPRFPWVHVKEITPPMNMQNRSGDGNAGRGPLRQQSANISAHNDVTMWSIAEQSTWLWLVIQAVLILSLGSHRVIHKESSRKPIRYMAPHDNGDKMRGASAGRSDLVVPTAGWQRGKEQNMAAFTYIDTSVEDPADTVTTVYWIKCFKPQQQIWRHELEAVGQVWPMA